MKISFEPLALVGLLISLASCELLTPNVPGTPNNGGTHDVFFGDEEAVQGSWTRTQTRTTNGASGEVSYTYTEIWTIDGETWERNQNRTDYADDREDDGWDTRGTVGFNETSGTLTFTETEINWREGDGWETSDPDDPLRFRNLIVDGVWYQTGWVRIGSGSGLAGTWAINVNDKQYRYQFDGAGTLSVSYYALDSEGEITGTLQAAGSGTYTWDGETLTTSGQSIECRLLPGGYLDLALGDTTSRRFDKVDN